MKNNAKNKLVSSNQSNNFSQKNGLPSRLFFFVLFLSISTLILFVFLIWNSYLHVETTDKAYFELRALQGEVKYCDEALTMSAYMSAATGDEIWENRYNQFSVKLDSLIKENSRIAKIVNAMDYAIGIDSINRSLVLIEKQAFSLCNNEQNLAALELLNSQNYKELKADYRNYIDKINYVIIAHLQKDLKYHRIWRIIALIAISIVVPFLFLVWFIIIRAFQRINKQRVLMIDSLSEKEKKLTDLLKLKDKFYSIVAHDIKSPFNSIMGFSDLLIEDYDKIDDVERQRYLSRINSSVKAALKLLENLLAWIQSQTGRIKINAEKIELKKEILRNIDFCKNNAEDKNIQLNVDIDDGLSVYTDKNMLNTISRNLLTNAIKFTPNNGHVKISATKKDSQVEIRYSDTGIGMKKEDIDKLFRADIMHSTHGTANEKGTGLGLILCKDFAEKLGGSIKVESKLGKGSTFSVCFNDK